MCEQMLIEHCSPTLAGLKTGSLVLVRYPGAEELTRDLRDINLRLAGKKIGLFGSWGWGEGAWMKDWEERCKADGADLQGEGVICQEAPDDAALAACRELGAKLA